MLKVFASEPNETLQCIDESLLVSNDQEFVIKTKGEIRYSIPESILNYGTLHKLGFQFGSGEYNTFKVSAWFE